MLLFRALNRRKEWIKTYFHNDVILCQHFVLFCAKWGNFLIHNPLVVMATFGWFWCSICKIMIKGNFIIMANLKHRIFDTLRIKSFYIRDILFICFNFKNYCCCSKLVFKRHEFELQIYIEFCFQMLKLLFWYYIYQIAMNSIV